MILRRNCFSLIIAEFSLGLDEKPVPGHSREDSCNNFLLLDYFGRKIFTVFNGCTLLCPRPYVCERKIKMELVLLRELSKMELGGH